MREKESCWVQRVPRPHSTGSMVGRHVYVSACDSWRETRRICAQIVSKFVYMETVCKSCLYTQILNDDRKGCSEHAGPLVGVVGRNVSDWLFNKCVSTGQIIDMPMFSLSCQRALTQLSHHPRGLLTSRNGVRPPSLVTYTLVLAKVTLGGLHRYCRCYYCLRFLMFICQIYGTWHIIHIKTVFSIYKRDKNTLKNCISWEGTF